MNILDKYFMKQALKEAIYSYEENEIPVGAIIVLNKTIIAKAHNLPKQMHDISSHAELQAIGSAGSSLKNKDFKKCSLYVTLEPCSMCLGAILWSNIDRLVIGISTKKKTKVIISKESNLLLKSFFKKKRNFLFYI